MFLRVFARVEIICFYEKFHGEHSRGSTVPREERKTPHGCQEFRSKRVNETFEFHILDEFLHARNSLTFYQ